MASFEKAKLATGEPRADFIKRRLGEGASAKAIHTEINAVGLYGGPAGKTWPISVVYQQKNKPTPAVIATPADEEVDEIEIDVAPVVVPPEYEDILTPQDVAEVRAEAAKNLKKKHREAARKELLAKATQDLEREARLAAQRGTAKGDMVDVMVDIAPYAADIRLDGVVYEHGRIARVNRKVAAVLMEQIQASWKHQDSLAGKNERPYRRTLSDRGLTANNAPMVRA